MNHDVLYGRAASRTLGFYEGVLGFVRVIEDPENQYAFMRAPASPNHHDIAFFTVGAQAGPSQAGRATGGLSHIAWEVPSLDDLVDVHARLVEAGALVGASDHGANKSLYARDPDGLEFEVMWLTPAETWGDEEHEGVVRPRDLEGAKQQYAEYGA